MMEALFLVLAGIAGLGVSVAIVRRPAIGAALILLVVNFEGTLTFGGISAVKLLSVLCVGIVAAQFLLFGREVRADTTTWLIVVFLAWIATTIFWTSDRSDFLSELTSLALQSFMYVLVINLVTSRDDLRLALWGYVIGGTILAVILSQTMISLNFRRSTTYMEVGGLGLNLAARMVGLNLLLAVLLIQLERGRLAKIMLIGAAVASGAGSVLALSRGNWYALLVSVAALVFVLSIKRGIFSAVKQGVLITVVGSVALYGASTFMLSDHGMAKLQERFESAYTFSDRASGRFDIWLTVLDPFLQRPLVGHGFSSFKELNEWKNAGAHNAFVLVAVEDGLVGVFLFCMVLGSVAFALWSKLRQSNANHMVLGWGMALFVFVFTASGVDTSVNRKYLWFVLGIITLLARYYGTEGDAERPPVADHAVGRTSREPPVFGLSAARSRADRRLGGNLPSELV